MDEESIVSLAELHIDLHKRWMPHSGQIDIGRAILYEGAKKVFVCAGRSFGKSQLASYIVSRIARETPNTTNYSFCPFITQGREIYWTPRLLHKLIPEDEIESINNTEMRITLKNGSSIKVAGAENFEAYRGVKLSPGSIAVIEECKDIRKEFLDAFMPNLSVNDPILLMIGTPPYKENHFIHYMNHAQSSPDWRYFWAPTEVNPHVSRDFLRQQEEFLTSNGMWDVWNSEYRATFTLAGHRSIFPMIAKMGVVPFEQAWPKDSNKWHLHVGLDPASSSIFAVVFMLFNPYTKKVICVDEIYEDKPEQMTARAIFERVNEKIKEFKRLGIKDVTFTYDAAAKWFKNEVNEIDTKSLWWLIPSDKSSGLDGEISAWRGIAAHGLLTIADRCVKLKWELNNYSKDDKGRLPDKDDHAWQAGAYALKTMGFDFTVTLEPISEDPDLQKRSYTPEDDMDFSSQMTEID